MASINCNCGKTRILLSTTAPRTQTLCCCDDCWDRFNVLHKHKGGPTPQDRNLPATYFNFENSLVIESGDVYFFKLDPDKPCPMNVASTCCNTFMIGHFVPYHHNTVVVPSPEVGGGKFLNVDMGDIKPSFLSFRQGKERFDDLLDRQPNLAGIAEFWLKGESVEEGFDGKGEWMKGLGEAVATMQEAIVGQNGGKSVDELLAERGGEDAVVELKA